MLVMWPYHMEVSPPLEGTVPRARFSLPGRPLPARAALLPKALPAHRSSRRCRRRPRGTPEQSAQRPEPAGRAGAEIARPRERASWPSTDATCGRPTGQSGAQINGQQTYRSRRTLRPSQRLRAACRRRVSRSRTCQVSRWARRGSGAVQLLPGSVADSDTSARIRTADRGNNPHQVRDAIFADKVVGRDRVGETSLGVDGERHDCRSRFVKQSVGRGKRQRG